MCHDIKQLRLHLYTIHPPPIKSPQKAILFAYMQKKLYLCALKYVFFNWEAEYEEK